MAAPISFLEGASNVFFYLFLANKATRDRLTEVEQSKASMEKEMKEKISKLEKELDNANDLVSATKRKGPVTPRK